MLMSSKILRQISSKLKDLLKNKEVIDIIIFGSVLKGKALPRDIDIAIITENPEKIKSPPEFHASIIHPKDFFINVPSIVSTLLKEGYSLKNNKPLSEAYGFSSKSLFVYHLSALTPSKKVRIVNLLKGSKEKGMVEKNKGKWLANQTFLIPLESEHLFTSFFINMNVKFQKFNVLIH